MPRGSRPGEYRGGRRKGIPNKRTAEVIARLEELGCDPIEGMVRIAQDLTPCRICDEGRLEDGKTCPQCHGTGKLQASPELRGKMYSELAGYVAPKRKAVEVTGEGGGPIALTDARRAQILEQAATRLLAEA
jgi:hypothetical protein